MVQVDENIQVVRGTVAGLTSKCPRCSSEQALTDAVSARRKWVERMMGGYVVETDGDTLGPKEDPPMATHIDVTSELTEDHQIVFSKQTFCVTPVTTILSYMSQKDVCECVLVLEPST